MATTEEGSGQHDVTIVIPAYKAEATIRRAIDSALAQPGVTSRIIIVVDGKLDRTAELISDYPRERVAVIEHPANLGAAISRNDGLAAADTDYVMFLDADDFIEGSLLSGLIRRMRSEAADIGFGPMQVLHEADLGEGPLVARVMEAARRALSGAKARPAQAAPTRGPLFQPSFTSSEDLFRTWHLEGNFVTPCSVVWRTSFIRTIGGWDPELTRNDDGELVIRAILKGAKFILSDEGRGVYVKHSMESLSQRPDNLQSMLTANEKLIAIGSSLIPDAVQRHVFGGHYFNIAWQSYFVGRDDVAEIAFRRSKELGFRTRGPAPHRIAFRLLGLKRTVRLLAQVRRAIRPRPAATGPAS